MSLQITERHLMAELLTGLREARAVCVIGARQAGKSTLVGEVAKQLGVAVSRLDDPLLQSQAEADPLGFIAGKQRPLVIDEIQLVSALLPAIKLQVDRDNTPGQFLMTGSANLLNLRTIPDALPGRVDYLTLHPFSQSELAGHSERVIDALFEGEFPSLSGIDIGSSAYIEKLLRGGYPEAQTRSLRSIRPFFDSYIRSLIGRDLGGILGSHDRSLMIDLLDLLSARSSSIVNLSSLGSDLKVSDKTAREYLELLANLFLAFPIRSWSRNLGQRMIKAPKWYVSDSGLLAARLNLSQKAFMDPAYLGLLCETFVVTEVARELSHQQGNSKLYYYRDTSQREVDLLIERPGSGVVAIEIKASATLTNRDFRQLYFLAEKLGPELKAACVLYMGPETVEVGERIAAVPIAGLWS